MRNDGYRIVCAAIALAASMSVAGCGAPDAPQRSVDFDAVRYVGRASCTSCHSEASAEWTGSHHDLAMDVASSESVLGDFDDAVYRHCGAPTRFWRRGGRFYVETEGPGGLRDTFEITHTFGVHPLQQYLVSFPDGRRQALTVAWDVERGRWFSLHGDDCVTHDDPLHWTRPAMNWNYMCADCHSTGLRRNYHPETNTYRTTFAEIDVSCEACHGPGALHRAWADGARVPETPGGLGLAVNLSRRAPASSEMDTCAPCHARRRAVYPNHIPGLAFLDHYEPVLLEEDLYFPDGQILDEVFVYGSFVQSKMHAQGVRCTDCHDPHSTRIRISGNALCGQCHDPAIYDAPAHHRHVPSSPGSQCVNCHMPARTYMVVDPRRDHGFRVPRPDLSLSLGAPNACNACHSDRSASWAADSIRAWRGGVDPDEHPFGPAIAAGRTRSPDGEKALQLLVRDDALPAIVRATALHLLLAYGQTAVPVARDVLRDREPLVRTLAVRTLGTLLPDQSLTPLVEPLLADTARLVRMEAARALARTGPGEATSSASFRTALEEYRTGQRALNDQAAAHLNLAVTYEDAGEEDAAFEAYQTALRIDSSFAPAYLNLAMLYNRRRERALLAGEREEADRLFRRVEESLRRAIHIAPEPAEPHYTLGLLLAEDEERLPEAAEHLARAAEADPGSDRMAYNAGLAFQRLGRADRAEKFLRDAARAAPHEPRYANALSILFIQEERWEEAFRATRRMQELAPGDPTIRQRLDFIRSRAGPAP